MMEESTDSDGGVAEVSNAADDVDPEVQALQREVSALTEIVTECARDTDEVLPKYRNCRRYVASG
ncbi:hypothetical protein M427DRAFT_396989 [Gonapodya prolifera JEL478]|uniref:Uncharacterized protein n=1 Tax=Gonapodya prolifera (strain JEL478) TaxID=1344416 RepID=A0A139A6I4_GONPJ|nr:hypothetical protein M427DRAFT_396989 [Gonapodya prolifera JEL478]|eukprot:KXS12412.1 hypothetical protein M427DRAFT_396989 [Gonapodya prolifera JEL478]